MNILTDNETANYSFPVVSEPQLQVRQFAPYFLLLPILVLLVSIPTDTLKAQGTSLYYRNNFGLMAPPGSFGNGMLSYSNPAMANLSKHDLSIIWSTEGSDLASIDDWGILSASNGLGFNVVRFNQNSFGATDINLNLAGGNRTLSAGLGYHYYTGDAGQMGLSNRISLGSIFRPNEYVSSGVTANLSTETDDAEGQLELGVRPLGTPRLTLFADGALQKDDDLSDLQWSAGGAVQVAEGISVVGRCFDDSRFSVGLSLQLGYGGLSSHANYNDSQNHTNQVNAIRMGDYFPNILPGDASPITSYVELDLSDRISYRKYLLADWMGQGAPRFYEILRTIKEAGQNPAVKVLLVNLAGIQVTPEQAWEIREELTKAQANGKKIVAYIENGGMETYHLASVADRLVMDPQGTLMLPGYVMGRTFFKGTLEKLGLQFDEWRYFEYKSAVENLSREEFSDADQKQRKALVEDMYRLTTKEISGSRDMAPQELDHIIDKEVMVSAGMALQSGLADTLARWHNRGEMLKSLDYENTQSLDHDRLHEMATASRQWSEPNKIALIYGLGPTSMHTGIKARSLSQTIRNLTNDADVKAIVFRVDSPGGDPMASDLVAEALAEASKKKPVVVSQGQVAGSGGYWISMNADTIVAGPNTITGSIGVIGGWLYDDGFSDKTGLSHDKVQQGEHADLFSGYRLPAGIGEIPTRNLTKEERARVEELFMELYNSFVEKVAAGRDTTESHIRDIGEGHIYSGWDGRDNGLVDEIANLNGALAIARTAAGLDDDPYVEVKEIGGIAGFFDLSGLMPFPVPTRLKLQDIAGARNSDEVDFIKLMLEHQPKPLIMMPPDTYPKAD